MTKDMVQSAEKSGHSAHAVLHGTDVALWGEARTAAHERALARLADALTAIEQATGAELAEPFPVTPERGHD